MMKWMTLVILIESTMKFNKRTKEHVNGIIKYIVSLGGKKVCEAASGTIYCDLTPIKKIRIADHYSKRRKKI